MIKVSPTEFWTMLKEAGREWNQEDPFRQSAVIAYYSIFSLPALLVIIVAVAGMFMGSDRVLEQVSSGFGDSMGSETANEVKTMVQSAGDIDRSTWALVIGIITLLFGATSVFAQFQKTLNLIFDVKAQPKKGWLKTMKDRIFSFGLIISIGFLLLVSFILTSAVAAVSGWAESYFPEWTLVIFQILSFVVSLAIVTLLFALIFKILPDVVMEWKSIWPGALLTGVLFEIGKFAMSYYFGQADPGADYGAAASIILILLWVSYSCMIVFFGAEFTKQYVLRRQGKIIPARDAVKIPAVCGEFIG